MPVLHLNPVSRTRWSPGGIDIVVRLLSCAVRVKGVSPDLLVALSAMYPDLVPAGSFQGTFAEDVTFDLGAVPEPADNPALILGQLEHYLDETAFEHLADYVMLHAGVVATGEASILVPAASGAGKSTLVAALCLSGFRYLSDEFAVLSPATLTAHAYAKSICLKPDGWRLVQEAFAVPAQPVDVQRTDGQIVHFLAAPRLYSDEQGAMVRAVLIPNRQIDGPAELEPITRTETLAMLMHQSLNLPWHGERGLDALARVVESAHCFRLTYSDLHDAVTIITTMVSEDSGWTGTQ